MPAMNFLATKNDKKASNNAAFDDELLMRAKLIAASRCEIVPDSIKPIDHKQQPIWIVSIIELCVEKFTKRRRGILITWDEFTAREEKKKREKNRLDGVTTSLAPEQWCTGNVMINSKIKRNFSIIKVGGKYRLTCFSFPQQPEA